MLHQLSCLALRVEVLSKDIANFNFKPLQERWAKISMEHKKFSLRYQSTLKQYRKLSDRLRRVTVAIGNMQSRVKLGNVMLASQYDIQGLERVVDRRRHRLAKAKWRAKLKERQSGVAVQSLQSPGD
jgi:hypothetical protein